MFKENILKIIIILVITTIFGFIYNQFHPLGIRWQILFSSYSNKNQDTTYIVLADSIFYSLNANILLFDTRTQEDYYLDHIKGAININLNDIIDGKLDVHDNKKKVFIYDNEGDIGELNIFANALSERGFNNIYILFGGYFSWLEKKYPVEEGMSIGE